MATFNTPFGAPQQPANKKELFITLGIIAALVVATLGYYFWPKSDSPTNETPPGITISTPKFQGLISGDIVCQIPGMYEFTDSAVSDYKMPGIDGDSNWNNLEQGIHMYHSIQPIYVKKIIDAIKPVAGNKIMIAYYPSDDGNISKKFAIYPELPDQTKITDPASYLIPGDQGFAIFSCKDTKIWQVKTEKMTNDDISGLLKGKTKGWILLAATNQPLATSLADYKNKIKSIWLQKDAGFEFQKAASLESATLVGDYKMVWLKVGPEQGAITNDPITNLKVNLATDNKSITLSWTAPNTTASVSYTITSYNAADGTKIGENTVNTTTFQVSDVVAGMSYRFAVDTIYPDSKKSGAVSSEIVKIPAGAEIKAVTNLVATLASDKTSISLSWNPPSTLESVKYSIATYVNGNKLADTNDITATTFTIPNIGAGKYYYATVKVIYSTGTSEVVQSNIINVPAGATIKGVTNLNAALAADKTSVNLTWTAPTTGFLLYTVTEYVDNGAKPGTQINKFSSDNGGKDTKFTTPALKAGQSYYFTVVTEYPDQSKSDEVKSNTVIIPTQQKVSTPLETCNETCYTTCSQKTGSEAYTCPARPTPVDFKITPWKGGENAYIISWKNEKDVQKYEFNYHSIGESYKFIEDEGYIKTLCTKIACNGIYTAKETDTTSGIYQIIDSGKIVLGLRAVYTDGSKSDYAEFTFTKSEPVIAITSCQYDSINNYSGLINFNFTTAKKEYNYKLEYEYENDGKKSSTIEIHPENYAGNYTENYYAPFAEIYGEGEVALYNLSGYPSKLRMLPSLGNVNYDPTNWCNLY